MGLFLSMSGVIGATALEVASSLRGYAVQHGGVMESKDYKVHDDGCLTILAGRNGVSVLYPWEFLEWDDASNFLSLTLQKPVFSFHIHDGDLWMYSLSHKGEFVDQFNPLPDYWGELEPKEIEAWKGNAKVIAQLVPSVRMDEIVDYLVTWSDELLDAPERIRAYSDDRFFYDDDWQLLDFMRRIGLEYPLDDNGHPAGLTFQFRVQET